MLASLYSIGSAISYVFSGIYNFFACCCRQDDALGGQAGLRVDSAENSQGGNLPETKASESNKAPAQLKKIVKQLTECQTKYKNLLSTIKNMSVCMSVCNKYNSFKREYRVLMVYLLDAMKHRGASTFTVDKIWSQFGKAIQESNELNQKLSQAKQQKYNSDKQIVPFKKPLQALRAGLRDFLNEFGKAKNFAQREAKRASTKRDKMIETEMYNRLKALGAESEKKSDEELMQELVTRFNRL